MEINNFANIVNRLMCIIGINTPLDRNVQNPKNLWMIDSFHLKDFMDIKRTEIGFEFSFSSDHEVTYLIKKEDEQKEEPPVYISDDVYLLNSSILLLIELAQWMSVHCKCVCKHKQFGLNYYAIREAFSTLIKTKELPFYKLRLSEKYDAITFMKDDVSLVFIAKSQAILDNIFKELNITDTKKQSVPYKSDVIIDGQLLENMIKGKVDWHGRLINIEIREDDTINSYINKWIRNLTEEKVSEIKLSVSKEIIKATFSQTNNVKNEMIREHTLSLYHDLHIALISFECKPLIKITFKSEKLYPDYSICCNLNSRGKVEDCFLE